MNNKENNKAGKISQPKLPSKRKLLQISDANQPALVALREKLLLKSYSRNTQRTYYYEFAQLLYVLKNHPVNELTPERLKDYFLYCVEKLKMTESQMQSRINAVKFYFEQVLGREKIFFDFLCRKVVFEVRFFM